MGWDKKETTQEKTPQKLQIHENPRKVGGVYGEYDAKTGGSIIYNSDKNTITKYDKNGVIIEQTDMQGNPIKTPENKPTNPTTPQDDKKTLTEEDIKNPDTVITSQIISKPAGAPY